jgi:hypothetical protein
MAAESFSVLRTRVAGRKGAVGFATRLRNEKELRCFRLSLIPLLGSSCLVPSDAVFVLGSRPWLLAAVSSTQSLFAPNHPDILLP